MDDFYRVYFQAFGLSLLLVIAVIILEVMLSATTLPVISATVAEELSASVETCGLKATVPAKASIQAANQRQNSSAVCRQVEAFEAMYSYKKQVSTNGGGLQHRPQYTVIMQALL